MIIHDRNFDDLTHRFERNIYGSAKGELRLAVVWAHLLQTMPQLSAGQPLRILDAGCGLGQMGVRLAQMGHEVVLADISQNMLDKTSALFAAQLPEVVPQLKHQSIQTFTADEIGAFDLIIFHAVLEWLASPQPTLHYILSSMAVDAKLSLMFYNRDALVYRNLLRGNWRKLEQATLQGDPGGLTPHHPLSLDEVEDIVRQSGLNVAVRGRMGVRVLYDYMERALRESRPFEEVLKLEMRYGGEAAYIRLGRYIHLLLHKESMV
ncbi:MAG: methyltransferase domain-containing protein [Zetaproteobacteria bacterium]|nr:methyltransferase domain-containing protein [Zetaproteobacteria bacterium]